jgi:Domain of unknown function (DUF4294)
VIKTSFLITLIVSLCVITATSVDAQQKTPSVPANLPRPELGPNDTIPVPAQVIGNELVPGSNLEWVYVSVPYPPELLKRRQAWNRLRNAVYVTYPYARKAGYIINDINNKMVGMESGSDRKKYIRSREKELKKEFADPLKDLSVYQGKVLMKLINRQTGNNCYEIIKEYKGGFNARIYQTVAFVFGSSLKQSYDPSDEDRDIESIVMEIERMYGRR